MNSDRRSDDGPDGRSLAAFLAAYAATLALGEALGAGEPAAWVLRPASGLLAAFVLAAGPRNALRQATLLAATALTHLGVSLALGRDLTAAAGSAASDVVLGLAAAGLHRRWCATPPDLGRVRDVFRFTLGVAPAASLLAATAAGLVHLATAPGDEGPGAVALATRTFVATLAGVLVVAPVVLTRTGAASGVRERSAGTPRAALVASVAVVSLLAFGQPWLLGTEFVHLRYAPLPLLVWAAFRLGPRDTTAATFLVAVCATALTRVHPATEADDLLRLQVFLVIASATALALSAATAERVEAEERLAERTDFLDRVIDAARVGVWDVDVGRRRVRVDAGWRTMLGLPDEVAEMSVEEALTYVHPEDRIESAVRWRGFLLPEGGTVDSVVRLRRADGSWRWVLARGSAVLDAEGRPDRIVGVNTDVTDLREAIDSARDAEARFRTAAEGSLDAFCLLTSERDAAGAIADFTVAYVNRNGAWMFARRPEEVVGRRLTTALPEIRSSGLLGRLTSAASTGRVFSEEMRLDVARSGITDVHVQVVATTDGVAVTLRDVTECRRLERDLLRSQKMEGLGRLAGGVAHDFNNLLTVMRGYCEMLRAQVGAGSPALPMLDQVLTAADRASDLTQRLLTFSRQERAEMRAVDVCALVRGAEGTVRRAAGDGVEVRVSAPEHRAWTVVEAAGLERSVVSLVANAREAMPDGGRLSLTVDEVDVTEADAARHVDARSGRFVRIRVADTGRGMAPEVLARVFEPFFTTKSVGQGTGLGLAICYAVVKQASGFITVESEPGAGTRVALHLPAAAKPVDEPRTEELSGSGRAADDGPGGAEVDSVVPADAPGTPEPAPAPRPRETILVVEDQPPVRRILVEGLRTAGYRVIESGDGHEALAASRRHEGEIGLLVTDVVMPGFRGPEIAALLRAERPGLRVLFVSGYTGDAFAGAPEGGTPPVILAKPFTLAALHAKVREVLEAAPAGV